MSEYLLAIFRLILIICVALSATSCTSKLHETYYLKAHDPTTNSTNYFRIIIDGCSSQNKIKYSIGFYDRIAVEQLFAENKLQREYLSTTIDVFDKETGQRLTDLNSQLQMAAISQEETIKTTHLKQALDSGSALLGHYRIRLKQKNDLLVEYKTSLDDAENKIETAKTALIKPSVSKSDLTTASTDLKYAHALLEGIRVAVDGELIVRFFNGAGIEMNVSALSMVIFVASDASRFTDAIRQLAEAEEVTQDILAITVGRRMQEAKLLEKRVSFSDQDQAAIEAFIAPTLETIKNTDDRAVISQELLGLATKVAGRKINTAEELKGFVAGMRAEP